MDEQLWALLDKGEGQMPREYIEYQVMREMGWNYWELKNCPADVVANIIRYLNTEGKFYKARSK